MHYGGFLQDGECLSASLAVSAFYTNPIITFQTSLTVNMQKEEETLKKRKIKLYIYIYMPWLVQ